MQKTITVIGHYGMSLLMDVQRFASVGETAEGIGLETEPGGKGYNQAIAASRLGADVNFITAVGGDTLGADLLGDAAHLGVHIIKQAGKIGHDCRCQQRLDPIRDCFENRFHSAPPPIKKNG